MSRQNRKTPKSVGDKPAGAIRNVRVVLNEQAATVLSPELVTEKVPEYWIPLINEEFSASAQHLIEAGRKLIAAKAEVGHGNFKTMFEPGKLCFGQRTAQMLMKIAQHRVLANPNTCSLLPAALHSLYALSTIDEDKLERVVASGFLTPDMSLPVAKSLAKNLKPSRDKAYGLEAGDTCVQPPYDEKQHEAAYNRIEHLLSTECELCPNTDWTKRLLKRVSASLDAINDTLSKSEEGVKPPRSL